MQYPAKNATNTAYLLAAGYFALYDTTPNRLTMMFAITKAINPTI